MIWRSPGVPSLLVTYGTSNDLFFSGHTAIAVYGSLELAHAGGTAAVILGVAIVLVEVAGQDRLSALFAESHVGRERESPLAPGLFGISIDVDRANELQG